MSRHWILAVLAVVGFTLATQAQVLDFPGIDNLDIPSTRPASPAPPDAPRAAPQATFAGTFTGDNLTLILKDPSDDGQYAGLLKMGDDQYALTAKAQGNRLVGAFKVDDQAYDFSAKLDGDTLTFTTGDSTYRLQRAAVSGNPLDQPDRPANPIERPAPVRPGDDRTAPPQPQRPKAPVVRLNPGQYELTDQTEMTMTSKSNSGTFTQQLQSSGVYGVRVGQPDAKGVIPVTVTLIRSNLVMGMNGMMMEFNTDRPNASDSPQLASLRLLVGKAIAFRILPNGKAEMDMVAYNNLLKSIKDEDRIAASNLGLLTTKLEQGFLLMPPMNYTALASNATIVKLTLPAPDPYGVVEVKGSATAKDGGGVHFVGKWSPPEGTGIDAQATYEIDAVFNGRDAMPSHLELTTDSTIVMAAIATEQSGTRHTVIDIQPVR